VATPLRVVFDGSDSGDVAATIPRTVIA
jgi:hypothetical protein